MEIMEAPNKCFIQPPIVISRAFTSASNKVKNVEIHTSFKLGYLGNLLTEVISMPHFCPSHVKTPPRYSSLCASSTMEHSVSVLHTVQQQTVKF